VRDQVEFYCLDDLIGKGNLVGIVDAFVGKIDLAILEFRTGSLMGDLLVCGVPRLFNLYDIKSSIVG
jgi:hypothetical protein